MTRAVVSESADGTHKDGAILAAADVNFVSNRFPVYRIGPDSLIMEPDDAPPSLKDIVAVETAQLIEQQKRLSVRVLAEKFEKGLAAAAKLSDEGKGDAGSLDRHVLMKKLRDVLETLRGRVAGRNKDDAEEAISLVEALAVQMAQREGELIREKVELRRLASLLQQASLDAKKVVEEERALARAEVENARAAIQRVQEALKEQEQTYGSTGKQELEELMKEVQEARRIKMLHQPSRVMDMESELKGLRIQLAEKSLYCSQLMKQVAMSKRFEDNKPFLYALEGSESLGSCLRVSPQMDTAPDISSCPVQWYRIQCEEEGNKELISGATRSVYAPEPFDVGRFLEAEISIDDEKVTVRTIGPIDPGLALLPLLYLNLGSSSSSLVIHECQDISTIIIIYLDTLELISICNLLTPKTLADTEWLTLNKMLTPCQCPWHVVKAAGGQCHWTDRPWGTLAPGNSMRRGE